MCKFITVPLFFDHQGQIKWPTSAEPATFQAANQLIASLSDYNRPFVIELAQYRRFIVIFLCASEDIVTGDICY